MSQQAQPEFVQVSTAQEVVEVKARADVKECLGEMSRTAEALKAITKVSNDTEKEVLTDLVAKGKKLSKEYDGIRKVVVAPFNEVVGAVNRFFNPTINKLRDICKEKESLISVYNTRKLEEQRKAEEKLKKEEARIHAKLEKAGVEKADIPELERAPKVNTTTRGTIGTSYEKKSWTFEITDKMELIKAVAQGQEKPELLEVNEKLIRALVSGGVREIPGVRVFQKISTTVRGR